MRESPWSPVCPHCRQIIWQAVPDLKRVRAYMARPARVDGVTSRDVADAFGWSIANACNKLRRLVRIGEAVRVVGPPPDGGGTQYVFRIARPTATPEAGG